MPLLAAFLAVHCAQTDRAVGVTEPSVQIKALLSYYLVSVKNEQVRQIKALALHKVIEACRAANLKLMTDLQHGRVAAAEALALSEIYERRAGDALAMLEEIDQSYAQT